MVPKDIGEQISSARKKRNYTQRELADKIGVSDKAVSKWERGVGCPDISLLLPLCEELNIDISILLGKGDISTEKNENQKEEQRLLHFAEYAKMKILDNRAAILKYITVFIGFASIISIGICLVVNYVLTSNFTWSLIASTAIAYGCIIVSVFLMCKQYRIEKTLSVCSVLLFPLLFVISTQKELAMYFPKAYVIALGAVILAWIIYGCIAHLRISIEYRLILVFVSSTLFNVFINLYTDSNMQQIIIQVISNTFGLVVLFVLGYLCNKHFKSHI